MRFSGEPGSFSISYVLDFVSKPSPRTELRHLRFSRLPEGRFAVVINNRYGDHTTHGTHKTRRDTRHTTHN